MYEAIYIYIYAHIGARKIISLREALFIGLSGHAHTY